MSVVALVVEINVWSSGLLDLAVVMTVDDESVELSVFTVVVVSLVVFVIASCVVDSDVMLIRIVRLLLVFANSVGDVAPVILVLLLFVVTDGSVVVNLAAVVVLLRLVHSVELISVDFVTAKLVGCFVSCQYCGYCSAPNASR